MFVGNYITIENCTFTIVENKFFRLSTVRVILFVVWCYLAKGFIQAIPAQRSNKLVKEINKPENKTNFKSLTNLHQWNFVSFIIDSSNCCDCAKSFAPKVIMQLNMKKSLLKCSSKSQHPHHSVWADKFLSDIFRMGKRKNSFVTTNRKHPIFTSSYRRVLCK